MHQRFWSFLFHCIYTCAFKVVYHVECCSGPLSCSSPCCMHTVGGPGRTVCQMPLSKGTKHFSNFTPFGTCAAGVKSSKCEQGIKAASLPLGMLLQTRAGLLCLKLFGKNQANAWKLQPLTIPSLCSHRCRIFTCNYERAASPCFSSILYEHGMQALGGLYACFSSSLSGQQLYALLASLHSLCPSTTKFTPPLPKCVSTQFLEAVPFVPQCHLYHTATLVSSWPITVCSSVGRCMEVMLCQSFLLFVVCMSIWQQVHTLYYLEGILVSVGQR